MIREWLPTWPRKGNVLWISIFIFGIGCLNEFIMFRDMDCNESRKSELLQVEEAITTNAPRIPAIQTPPQVVVPPVAKPDGKNRIAVIIAWFARNKIPPQLKESIITFSYNADILDYFIFMEKNTNAAEQMRSWVEFNNFTNVIIVDSYSLPNKPDLGGFDFIKAKLKAIFVNYIEMPNLDFDMGGRFCDIRPFFGEIFYEWTKDYTHWAWSDKDSYVGNLTKYMNNGAWLDDFDVVTLQRLGEWHLFTAGQLTIMRNHHEGRWFWTRSDMRILYRNFNNETKPHVMDEFWYSRPVVWSDDIPYLQTYVQTSKGDNTVWGIECLDEAETQCAPRIVSWQNELKKEYWTNAFESNTQWPENLDHMKMDEFVRFKKPNLEDAGLGGYFSFYQDRNESWWRQPVDHAFFDRIQGRSVVLEPGLTHSRSKLCRVKPEDLDYFKEHGKHHGCINGVRENPRLLPD